MSSQLGIWSYGAQITQPIFTAGALTGNLKLAKSENRQALIVYQQVIQRAFGEVSDALIGYQKLHEVRLRQEIAVADLQESTASPTCAIRAAPPHTSKSSTASALSTPPNSPSPKRVATNTRVLSISTGPWAAAGSNSRSVYHIIFFTLLLAKKTILNFKDIADAAVRWIADATCIDPLSGNPTWQINATPIPKDKYRMLAFDLRFMMAT
jgi:hypothetical protein